VYSFRLRGSSVIENSVSIPETMLRTVADVDAFVAGARFFRTRKTGKVVLHLGELSARESMDVEARLNASAQDCGCNVGAVVASFGFVLYVSFLLATVGSVRHWRLRDVVWGAIVCLLCALLGKVFGLVLARIRFVNELQRLRARLGGGAR
jgi:hypothetical protein